jgi:hypothetical protein
MLSDDFTNLFFVAAGILSGSVIIVGFYLSLKKSSNLFDEEIKPFVDYQNIINAKIKEKSKEDVTDIIQTELNQLTQYYIINKSQAKNSFYFSVFISLIGTFTLIGGIWLFYLRPSPNLPFAALTSISGVMLQFIGGSFFILYRKSIEQVNNFFSQLIITQDTALAIQLTKELHGEEKQTDLTEKIVLTLLERSSNPPNETRSTRIYHLLNQHSQPYKQQPNKHQAQLISHNTHDLDNTNV